jgi:phage major head subunit gpT-like protein
MLINEANLTALGVSFNVIYAAWLEKIKLLYAECCTIIPATGPIEDFSWLGRMPSMKEWLDERKHEKLAAFQWDIRTRKWESTVDVERTDIEDDKLGMYKPIFQQLATVAANHPEDLFWQLVNAGDTTLCYDGQNFFDDLHPDPFADNPGGTFDNHHDLAFSRVNLAAMILLMRMWTDARGDPLHVNPTHLYVDPTNQFLAQEILQSTLIVAAGNTDVVLPDANVFRNIVQLRVSPWIPEGTWYLMDLSKPIKPFAFLDRIKPETLFTGFNLTQVNTFERDIFSYGVRARYNHGYLFPHLALRCDEPQA